MYGASSAPAGSLNVALMLNAWLVPSGVVSGLTLGAATVGATFPTVTLVPVLVPVPPSLSVTFTFTWYVPLCAYVWLPLNEQPKPLTMPALVVVSPQSTEHVNGASAAAAASLNVALTVKELARPFGRGRRHHRGRGHDRRHVVDRDRGAGAGAGPAVLVGDFDFDLVGAALGVGVVARERAAEARDGAGAGRRVAQVHEAGERRVAAAGSVKVALTVNDWLVPSFVVSGLTLGAATVGATLLIVADAVFDPEPASSSVTVTLTVKLPLFAYVCDAEQVCATSLMTPELVDAFAQSTEHVWVSAVPGSIAERGHFGNRRAFVPTDGTGGHGGRHVVHRNDELVGGAEAELIAGLQLVRECPVVGERTDGLRRPLDSKEPLLSRSHLNVSMSPASGSVPDPLSDADCPSFFVWSTPALAAGGRFVRTDTDAVMIENGLPVLLVLLTGAMVQLPDAGPTAGVVAWNWMVTSPAGVCQPGSCWRCLRRVHRSCH